MGGPGPIEELNRIGKDRTASAGLWTAFCVVVPVASAIDQGFGCCFIADARGDVSPEALERAVERMVQLGAKPMTALQCLLDLQRDRTRQETHDQTGEINPTRGRIRTRTNLLEDDVRRLRKRSRLSRHSNSRVPSPGDGLPHGPYLGDGDGPIKTSEDAP